MLTGEPGRPLKGTRVNGAQALIHTLTGCGVDTCFSNPGTSEMHFVAALDTTPQLRGVLCLFEGTATGAADGYGRMRDRPATALLHLGPGLANGLANLHNARRAHTPVLAIVGDHATYHSRLDAPLESDIESLARPVSGWFRRTAAAALAGPDAADAVAAASRPPGRRGHPGAARRRVLDRRCRARAGPADPRRRAGPGRGHRRSRRRAAQRGAVPAAARRDRAARRRPVRRQQGRPGHRGPAAGRDVPGPAGTWRGPARRGPAGLPGRVRRVPAGRRQAPDPGRGPGPGLVLRLSG